MKKIFPGFKRCFAVLLILFLTFGFSAYGQSIQSYGFSYAVDDSTSSYPFFNELISKLKTAINKSSWITLDTKIEGEDAWYGIKTDETTLPYISISKTQIKMRPAINQSKVKSEFIYKFTEDKIPVPEEFSNYYSLHLKSAGLNITWYIKDVIYMDLFLSSLRSLKYKKYRSNDDDLSKFKDIAEKYRSMEINPEITEEVRKYVVQATAATNEKKYQDAISKYRKAIELDPTYPDAHFNLALLHAQVEEYEGAIFEMKKYLMLMPDAKDSRAAKDKIYEWEAKLE